MKAKRHYTALSIKKLRAEALHELLKIDALLSRGEESIYVYDNYVVPLLKKYGFSGRKWKEVEKIKNWCGYYNV